MSAEKRNGTLIPVRTEWRGRPAATNPVYVNTRKGVRRVRRATFEVDAREERAT